MLRLLRCLALDRLVEYDIGDPRRDGLVVTSSAVFDPGLGYETAEIGFRSFPASAFGPRQFRDQPAGLEHVAHELLGVLVDDHAIRADRPRRRDGSLECANVLDAFAWRGQGARIKVRIESGDDLARLASYAKQAKDDQLRKLADRIQARAIRRGGAWKQVLNAFVSTNSGDPRRA